MKYSRPIYKKMHQAKVPVCLMVKRKPWYCPACVKRFKDDERYMRTANFNTAKAINDIGIDTMRGFMERISKKRKL